MTKYRVTAIDANKGYRVAISKEMSLDEAETFRDRTECEMNIATPLNQWVSDIQIEVIE